MNILKILILHRSKTKFVDRLNVKINDELLTKEELAEKLQTEINKRKL